MWGRTRVSTPLPWREHSPVTPRRPHTGGHLQASLARQPSGLSEPTGGDRRNPRPHAPGLSPEGRERRILHPEALHVGSNPSRALKGSVTQDISLTVQLLLTHVVFAEHVPDAGFAPGPCDTASRAGSALAPRKGATLGRWETQSQPRGLVEIGAAQPPRAPGRLSRVGTLRSSGVTTPWPVAAYPSAGHMATRMGTTCPSLPAAERPGH